MTSRRLQHPEPPHGFARLRLLHSADLYRNLPSKCLETVRRGTLGSILILNSSTRCGEDEREQTKWIQRSNERIVQCLHRHKSSRRSAVRLMKWFSSATG